MPQERTATRERKKTSKIDPPRYKVIMHNDDETTMDFVVEVLMHIFFHNEATANTLMLKIHNEGSAIVGVYDYDTALSKVFKVKMKADEQNFPLELTVEKE